MDHYHVIASRCLPESETIATGIVLDYGLGHLKDMDFTNQGWIQHWNLTTKTYAISGLAGSNTTEETCTTTSCIELNRPLFSPKGF